MRCFGERSKVHTRSLNSRKKLSRRKLLSRGVKPKVKRIEDVAKALTDAGLRRCSLIVGIDFTGTNETGCKTSFSGNALLSTAHDTVRGRCCTGRNLHDLAEPSNPFLVALNTLPRVLEGLEGSCRMFCYGFGDTTTKERSVFAFFPEDVVMTEHRGLVQRYRQMVPFVALSAPTSCAPLIRQAMRRVYQSCMEFHLLLILLAGPISANCRAATADAIFHASYFPISIVTVGMGDGPWDEMRRFAEELPDRRWENFSFVEFKEFRKLSKMSEKAREKSEAKFALRIMEDLPYQFGCIKESRGPVDQQSVLNIVSRIPHSILTGPPTDNDASHALDSPTSP